MKRKVLILILFSCITGFVSVYGQEKAHINIKSSQSSGLIDEKIYGQLFEHIYFSANNGVWQELIYERSFEPEHYPGIHPRDGYFDGWFVDDSNVLHSPTRYEQPIDITTVNSDSYDITMDVNWRAYKLAKRSWSGGLMDMRIQFKNQSNGEPYFFRIHDPYYEGTRFSPAQTEAMIQAQRQADALAKVQVAPTKANFSFAKRVEKEVMGFGGRSRKVVSLDAIKFNVAKQEQINENQDWHKLRISVRGNNVKAYWDGKVVLSSNLESFGTNDIKLWVNYTEALFKNIQVRSANGKEIYFEGLPKDVQLPSIAQQWKGFGNGEFSLIKDDAVNMRYSQNITAINGAAGVSQGPQNIVAGEKYIGSIYAKGDGNAVLSVELRNGNKILATQSLGKPNGEWTKYEFVLNPALTSDGEFAISVSGGSVQVDQVSMTTQSGIDLGGFRPDIFKAVDELHPTCLRWPGGGYVAQYHWKWGIGPQEERQRWPHWMWMDYDQNCFGTDEFIRFCRELNTEPIIVVSVEFERPSDEYERILQEAVDWLRYCNEPATGEWGRIRAANGHPEPYNVKYWEIDNEMWEMGIERYEKCVRDFSTAMRAVDPSIKIIACGGFSEDKEFLQRSGKYFDYLSLHHYEQMGGYASGPGRLKAQYDNYAKMIADCPNPNIKLFISEWNLQSIDWRTGLFAGGFLNVCETTPVVELGAAALFIRRTDMPDWNNAFINFDYKDVFVAPNYQVTKLWYDNYSPYRLDFDGDTGNVSVSTSLSKDGSKVIVKIVNAGSESVELKIDGDWKGIENAIYSFYAPGSLDAANSMENKNAVELKTINVAPTGNSLILHLDALSAGVLNIEKQF